MSHSCNAPPRIVREEEYTRHLLSGIATHFSVVLLLICAVIVCVPSTLHAQSSDVPPETNIHIATLEGNYEVIKRLLDAGVSPDEFNSTGFAPLHSAVRANRSDIVELLLDYGADVNIQSRTSIDPEQGGLHIAARNGYLDLINLLLAREADPNLQDSRGNTPLHDAAISGDRSITRALVRRGADVYVRNVAGADVLEVADESLGRDAFSQIVIQVNTVTYLYADDLSSPTSSSHNDIGAAFSMLFPVGSIGDAISFIGPEVGASFSVNALSSLSDLFIFRIPIHAVFSIFLPTARYHFSFEAIAGATLNTLIGGGVLGNITFDVGGRLEINSLYAGWHYILPVSVPFGDSQLGMGATNSSVQRYLNNAGQNLKVTFGLKFRIWS